MSRDVGPFRPSSERIADRLIIVVLLLVTASAALRARGGYRTDAPPEGARAGRTSVRIDPNAAPRPELALLPGIGEQIAGRIVARREALDGRPAYCTPDDLMNVERIGPRIAARIAPYLRFPVECAER